LNSVKEPVEGTKAIAQRIKLTKQQQEAEEAKLQATESSSKQADMLLKDGKQMLKDQQTAHKLWLKKQQDEVAAITQEIRQNKIILKDIATQINERKTYQKEQELVVDTAVEAFNSRIRELQADIAEIERQKDTSLHELVEAQEQAGITGANVLKLNQRLEALKKLYEDSAAQYKIELNTLRTDIDAAKANHKKILKEGQTVLERLADKEREYSIRTTILDERESKQAQESEYLRKKKAFIQK
jgi:hypothetical protein